VRCEDLRVASPFLPAARAADPRGVTGPIAAGLVLVLAAACWVPHLPDSLWLDETLTFWVVQDGLAEAVERSVNYQPQPAYCVFMWFWTQLAGSSEIALRLPSLLAALGACVALARLGARLTGDREAGLLGMLVFASSFNVFRESVDARSYTLGLVALLCLWLGLLRWLEQGRWRDAWLCGVLGALLPQLHLFFVLVYPAFAVQAALWWSRGHANSRQVAGVGLLLGLGALAYLPVASALVEHAGAYSFVAEPRWRDLFTVFAWVPPVSGLIVGVCAAGVLGQGGARVPAEDADGARLLPRAGAIVLAVWVLVPVVVLFAVSMLTETSVFLGRYLIPAIPAVCLIYGLALRGIPSGRARVLAAAVLALAAFVVHERPDDDFRGAARFVNEFVAGDASVPVLLASGLVEGEDEAWLRDPALSGYLNAPTAYYPLEGRVLAVPRKLFGQPLAHEIVDPVLRGGGRFAAVEWTGNGANILRWLEQEAGRAGYRVSRRPFGVVRVAVFTPR
jgi:hypothetical protein